jgi:hypothetical protein
MPLIAQKYLEAIKNEVVTRAKNLTPGGSDSRLASAIGATVTSRQDGWSIRYKVDIKKAPEARAFEYGSGIHAQVGPKKHYIIKPRNKKVLAFKWEAADVNELRGSRIGWWRGFNKFQNSDTDGPASYWNRPEPSFAGLSGDGSGRLLFNWVRHPGVEAANKGKGYLGYAVELTKGTLSEKILEGAVEGLGKEIYKGSRFGFARDKGGRFVRINSSFRNLP